jgi:drug/metabolite transporter (DMT)-like permease
MNWRVLLRNWHLAAGVLAYLGSSALFVLGLRKGELSILYPMISLGYIFTLIWSRLFFGEPLTKSKFAGVGLILVGIVFLAAGNR